MKQNCLRVPRIYIPRHAFQKWAVIACDQHTSDRNYWERVSREVGDSPSTLSFILPELYLEEADENTFERIHENMYRALEEGYMRRLDRGCVLTLRTTQSGTRFGILACIDLENYSYEINSGASVQATEDVVPSRLPPRMKVREGAILEFPHAMVFYNDKKKKVRRSIDLDKLEKLYDFELMEEGGRVCGYYMPYEKSVDLLEEMVSRTDPCFAVADGNHSLATAKACWDKVKMGLSEEERCNHPARFAMAEFVNVYDEAIVLHPIHRVVKDVEEEVFCDFVMRNLKCERKGNVLYPSLAGAEGVERCDALIAQFLKSNGGSVDYIHGEEALINLAKEEGSVGIALKGIEKGEIFSALKAGQRFPRKTFSVGEEWEKRYYLEGREINYD